MAVVLHEVVPLHNKKNEPHDPDKNQPCTTSVAVELRRLLRVHGRAAERALRVGDEYFWEALRAHFVFAGEHNKVMGLF